MSVPLDGPIVAAAAGELSFYEHVRFEAISNRFARLPFTDRRRLMLSIGRSPFDPDAYFGAGERWIDGYRLSGLGFKVGIYQRNELHKDYRIISDVDGVATMLQAVVARLKHWRSIRIEDVDFGSRQLLPLLKYLFDILTVSKFTGKFWPRAHESPPEDEIERLVQWIKKYSSQLRHLALGFPPLDDAAVALVIETIEQCPKLHRLNISGPSLFNSAAFRGLVLRLPRVLPSLHSLQLDVTTGHLTAQSIRINDVWLVFFGSLTATFQPLFERMKKLELKTNRWDCELPLPDAQHQRVISIVALMQLPVTLIIGAAGNRSRRYHHSQHHATFDSILKQCLPLARDHQASVCIDIDSEGDLYKTDDDTEDERFGTGWQLSIDQFVTAMASLPADQRNGLHMPTLASIHAGQQSLTFHYGDDDDGQRVVVKNCYVPASEATLTLKLLCEKHLLRTLTVDNAFQYFKVAIEGNSASVKKAARKLFWNNFKAAVASDGWKSFIPDDNDRRVLEKLMKKRAKD